MITTNLILQLFTVMAQYQTIKLREAAITLSFLRPAVDAYRVSTNHEDDEATMNCLTEMRSTDKFEARHLRFLPFSLSCDTINPQPI